jgi:Anaphase-promoting complex, subunit 10 (APC10)
MRYLLDGKSIQKQLKLYTRYIFRIITIHIHLRLVPTSLHCVPIMLWFFPEDNRGERCVCTETDVFFKNRAVAYHHLFHHFVIRNSSSQSFINLFHTNPTIDNRTTAWSSLLVLVCIASFTETRFLATKESISTMEVSIQETLNIADKRELGAEAVFSISSAKLGNGVEQLRDNNLETYWQSDGVAPHRKWCESLH